MNRSSTESSSEHKFKYFVDSCATKATKVLDRAVCFIWYRLSDSGQHSTLSEIIQDFDRGGFASPNVTRLRQQLSKDRRTVKKGKDAWSLKSDHMGRIDDKYGLTKDCLLAEASVSKPLKNQSHEYVDVSRLQSVIDINSTQYDFTRLVELLNELNHCFEANQFVAVICLLRAVLDHVPPIFGHKSFVEVSNNYSGGKSFRSSMKNLEGSSRKIADSYLHTQIRKSESLPNRTQVDFTNDLDVLLAEVIRIVRSTS